MRRRLVKLCLLAYPRRDREMLRGLVLDLAETQGVGRQVRSLLTRPARVLAGVAAAIALSLAAVLSYDAEEIEVYASTRAPAADPVASIVADVVPEGASGALVAAKGGRLVHCDGFGLANRRTAAPVSCDTAFDIGSVTKQFTAAAILALEQQGRLRVTDRIGRHLGHVPRDKRAITIHQLLTHTAGFPETLGGDYERLTRRAMVRKAMRAPLRRGYRYSNVGYSLLAAIVERASGTDYESYLRRRLFAPAGMTQTGYVLPSFGDVAIEYDGRGRSQGRPMDHPWAADGPFWNLRGNGGLLSTARDMYRWHLALRADAILGQRAKAKLFAPYVRETPRGDSHYGYGWVILETPFGKVATHNGGNGWSYAEYTRVLTRDVMVFWVTNHAAPMERVGAELTERVARRLLASG